MLFRNKRASHEKSLCGAYALKRYIPGLPNDNGICSRIQAKSIIAPPKVNPSWLPPLMSRGKPLYCEGT
jgi:hypothetical protein